MLWFPLQNRGIFVIVFILVTPEPLALTEEDNRLGVLITRVTQLLNFIFFILLKILDNRILNTFQGHYKNHMRYLYFVQGRGPTNI